MKIRVARAWKNAFWESVELFVAVTTFLVGIPTAINPDTFAPQPMQGLDGVLLRTWAAFILVGGTSWVHGILSANLYTRKAGLMLVAGAAFALGAVLISTGDLYRIIGSVTYFLGSVALVARYYALGKLGAALSLATRLRKIMAVDDEA